MKKIFAICLVAVMMITACKKEENKAPTPPASTSTWTGQYYCASFYNGSGDTICKKVVTVAQFDSMAYNYGAHIWCTYPNNSDVNYSGRKINVASECH